MRASIVVASCNEGDLLWRTVTTCVETIDDLDYEIVVADDESVDGSLAALESELDRLRRERREEFFPEISILSSGKRRGPSPTKHLGACAARGDTLVFLDGHTKPEPGAIAKLVDDIEELGGSALVTPRIPGVDPETWEFTPAAPGYGFCMNLLNMDCAWIPKEQLARRGRYFECPATIGCSLAVSRELYHRLGGFDADMREWGLEDIDFGLKAWLCGHDSLVDGSVAIGHRFQSEFKGYTVTEVCVLANKLRMARKNFSDAVFDEWVGYTESVEEPETWERAWAEFESRAESVARERDCVLRNCTRTEFDYAERYGLEWPDRSAFTGSGR